MKVVAVYIEDLPQMVNNMIESLQGQDFEALAGLAHNLKGSSGLAGFPDLASQAAQIQQAAQHQKTEDFAGILQKIIELCRMVGAKMDDISVDELLQQSLSAQADRTSQDKKSPEEPPDSQIESDRNFSEVQSGSE